LGVQHACHLVGAARRFEPLARAPQIVTGGCEIALLPGQYAEPALQPPHLPLVTRRLGEAQAAAVPRLGARPFALGPRHVPQPLARRDRARLIELRLGQRERALELTRAFDVLTASQTQIPEGAQRLHFGTPVLQGFRHVERQLVPRVRLEQPAHVLLEPAAPDEGAHDPRGVTALPGFERLYVRLGEHVHVLGDAMQRLRQAAPQLVGVDAALAQREVRAGARPQGPLVRARDRDQQRAQRGERLELWHELERLFDAHRRKRGGHNPYSFIFRVSVLRWMPRISAAAPICPLVCASTRAM